MNKILANGVDFKKSVNGLFAEIKRIESTAVPVDKVAEVLEITVYKKLGMGKEILYGTGTVSITTILLAIEPNTQFNQKFKPNALFKPIYIKYSKYSLIFLLMNLLGFLFEMKWIS